MTKTNNVGEKYGEKAILKVEGGGRKHFRKYIPLI